MVRKQSKNWLLLKIRLSLLCLLFVNINYAQFANQITNGGFELKYNCNQPEDIGKAKGWRSIDSTSYGNLLYANKCYSTVPYATFGFQYARNGDAFGITGALCQPTLCANNNSRGYFRNRLKSTLVSGKVYCVKFYISISDNSSYGIDGMGAYFGDNSLDTITVITTPLTYLVPQVQNVANNLLIDTLNWTVISGTFIATGIEKHAIFGNFKSDAATTKTIINNTYLPNVFTNFFMDDVSCIPLDLPAFAGPDVFCIPGNSVYIGRPSDVGIDEACMWYKLPNTTTAIDTVAGLWVTPTGTSTYVVKQDICGVVKWDTVVVMQSGVGVSEIEQLKDKLSIYPIPGSDEINLRFETDINDRFKRLIIYNSLGQILREEEVVFKNNKLTVKTNDLPIGVYTFKLLSNDHFEISKRFVIAR